MSGSRLLFVAEIGAAMYLLTIVHLMAIALGARALRVSVTLISFGIGPKLFQLGQYVVRAIPFGGYVRFKDSRHPEPGDSAGIADAFDRQPRLVQALIALVGPAALIVLAFVLGPTASLYELGASFRQLIVGSVQPLSVAQHYVGATQGIAIGGGFVALAALLSAKFAALNLLPLPALNGGQAVISLIRKPGSPTAKWEEALQHGGILIMLAFYLSWAFALGYYVFGQ